MDCIAFDEQIDGRTKLLLLVPDTAIVASEDSDPSDTRYGRPLKLTVEVRGTPAAAIRRFLERPRPVVDQTSELGE